MKGVRKVSKEVTNHDVLIAVKEIANQVSELSTRVSGVEHQVSELSEFVNDRFVTMENNIKKEFKKTNNKIDLFDTQLEILSSTILITQAEVKRLQKAR